jgi:hypothetical protein
MGVFDCSYEFKCIYLLIVAIVVDSFVNKPLRLVQVACSVISCISEQSSYFVVGWNPVT